MLELLKSKLNDFHWQSLIVLGATLSTFFVAAVASFVFQYLRHGKAMSFSGFLRFCFPAEGWKSKSSMMDVFMYFAGKFIRGILAIGDSVIIFAVATGVSALIAIALPNHSVAPIGVFGLIAWSIVFFVFADFANFLTHYLQHKVGFLWELHKVHHSATFLTPLTTARMHPLADKFDHLGSSIISGLPMGIAMYLYGLSLPEIIVMTVNANLIGTILVLDALRHSHFPVSFGKLNYILVSPHMHQLHHSARFEHWDKNMGNKLSIWDFLFGTAFIPDPKEPLTYGIGRGDALDARYTTLYGVYIRPLADMVRTLFYGPEDLPDPTSAGAKPSSETEPGLIKTGQGKAVSEA